MSSLSVSLGLQSCLEPKLMEPCVMRLKLTPSKSNFSPSMAPASWKTTNNKESTNDDCDVISDRTEDIEGWSFLQCLQNNPKKTADDDNEKVYVHPLVKRSSSLLSEKSLEMCTESLGSETGSLVCDSAASSGDIITMISSSPPERAETNYTSTQLRESFVTKRTNNRSVSFPPPLTSISGVQVRPHREGGRLVLQAVTVSSSPTYFHAERSDGRLRLCLVRNPFFDEDDDQEDDEEFYDDEEEEEDEEVRGEIGIEKLPRPSRCNEGGGGGEAGNKLLWEPFWVAT